MSQLLPSKVAFAVSLSLKLELENRELSHGFRLLRSQLIVQFLAQLCVLHFKLLDPLDDFRNVDVELGCAEVQVEDVCVVATTDHPLLEFSPVLSNDVLDFLGLQSDCNFESLRDDLVTAKVPHGTLKALVLPAHLDDVVDKTRVVAFKLRRNTVAKLAVGHVLQNQDISRDLLLLEKLIHDLRRFDGVDDEELEALAQGDLDGDVVFRIDWLDKLIKLAEIATAPRLEFFEHLYHSSVASLYLLLALELGELEAGLEEIAFDLTNFGSKLKRLLLYRRVSGLHVFDLLLIRSNLACRLFELELELRQRSLRFELTLKFLHLCEVARLRLDQSLYLVVELASLTLDCSVLSLQLATDLQVLLSQLLVSLKRRRVVDLGLNLVE